MPTVATYQIYSGMILASDLKEHQQNEVIKVACIRVPSHHSLWLHLSHHTYVGKGLLIQLQ